jgi:predicted DNA-binding protein
VIAVRLLNSIRLDKGLEARLERLVRLTGRSKSYYVNQALQEQIQTLESRLITHPVAWHANDGRERILPLYELECALGRDE